MEQAVMTRDDLEALIAEAEGLCALPDRSAGKRTELKLLAEAAQDSGSDFDVLALAATIEPKVALELCFDADDAVRARTLLPALVTALRQRPGRGEVDAEIAALRQALAASEASRERLVAVVRADGALLDGFAKLMEALAVGRMGDVLVLRSELTDVDQAHLLARAALTPADLAIVSQSADHETQPALCLTGEQQA